MKKQQVTKLYRAQIEGAALVEKRRTLREQQEVLKRSGLDREADRLTPRINALTADIQRCARQAMHEHEQCVVATHLALVACDLMTEVADRVADIIAENSALGKNDAMLPVVNEIRKMADEFNRVVQAIDMLPGNAGMVYADMSEFAIQGILDTMLNRINEYLNKPGTNAIK